MQQSDVRVLFAFFKSAISGEPAPEDVLREYSPDSLPSMIKNASKHDLAHLLAQGLKNNGLMPDDPAAEKVIFKAIYRYERLKHEYDKICTAFEKAKIPYMPLKGAIMREYYREPWMRTSSDIDVLVKESDLERAAAVLVSECAYKHGNKGPHDIPLYAENGVHIELHYDLLEEGRAANSVEVLADVWRCASVREKHDYFYEMTDEMFYFYHVSHAAKHFENGGCGIRSLLDLWILDSICPNNKDCRDELLNRGGILKFANAVRHLAKVWFGDAYHTELTRALEDYILQGGTYGDGKNRVTLQGVKKGGKVRYLISRIILPYEEMKFYYPITQKHPVLTPLMQVRWWCKLIFCGHLGRSTAEINYSFKVTDNEVKDTIKLLDSIGLSQNKK